MAFEEVSFPKICQRPKLGVNEITIRYTEKKYYLRFNQTLSEELIKEGFKYCTLEWDRETDELRIKFRKFDDNNTVRLCLGNKEKNLCINHKEFVAFVRTKLKIEEERAKINIGEDRSNTPVVQTRYITK